MREGRERERLTVQFAQLSPDDAYSIQEAGVELRLSRGEKVIGYKMGLTSKAKREQMNLHSPIYGVLTDAMEVRDGVFKLAGGPLPTIHPKIEPEIAFFVEKELKGVVSFDQALDACGWVAPAMEILDSRYVGFKYFSLPDVIADNASSSYFALSPRRFSPREVDLADLEMVIEARDASGAIVETQRGSSRDISDHPVNSLIQQVALLDHRGLSLPAGSLVLAGAATQAIPLQAGQSVRLRVAGLGEFEVRTKAV